VVPEPPSCDIVITPANADRNLALLNRPELRVFCFEPGDYRAARYLVLRSSGSEYARRWLRLNASFPTTPAIRQTERAIIHGLMLDRASWWVIEGLTIQPTGAQDLPYLVTISGGSHNVLERNLLDASQQINQTLQSGVVLGATSTGVPSTWNSIQNNVIRGGNASRLGTDYTGVNIPHDDVPGGNNDFNRILDNEIHDWGDGVQLSASNSCDDAAVARGTIIDGNDIYVTADKRVRCSDGSPDPSGECSCAENGVDVKSSAGPEPAQWTQITNNRLWGFRPTLRDVPSCGGTGSRGQAITAGNACAANVFVASNAILDSTVGVLTEGPNWLIVGNLLTEIRAADEANGNFGVALYPLEGPGVRVQFNTVVGVDNAYEDAGSDIVTQCNAVIHDVAAHGPGGRRGSNHVTDHNFAYEAPSPNFVGSTNRSFATDAESENRELCFTRKRWTGPEDVCIPFGEVGKKSPHAVVPAACSSDLGADFGLPGIGYPNAKAWQGKKSKKKKKSL
jgi:hypothetical protein